MGISVRSCRRRKGWQQAAAEQLVNPSLKGTMLLTLAIKYINNENKLCLQCTRSVDSHHITFRRHVIFFFFNCSTKTADLGYLIIFLTFLFMHSSFSTLFRTARLCYLSPAQRGEPSLCRWGWRPSASPHLPASWSTSMGEALWPRPPSPMRWDGTLQLESFFLLWPEKQCH